MHVPKMCTIPWHVQSGAKKQVPNPLTNTPCKPIHLYPNIIIPECPEVLSSLLYAGRVCSSFLSLPRNGRSSDSRQVSTKWSMVHYTHMRNFLMHYDTLVPTIFMVTFLPNCSFYMIHACVLFFIVLSRWNQPMYGLKPIVYWEKK